MELLHWSRCGLSSSEIRCCVTGLLCTDILSSSSRFLGSIPSLFFDPLRISSSYYTLSKREETASQWHSISTWRRESSKREYDSQRLARYVARIQNGHAKDLFMSQIPSTANLHTHIPRLTPWLTCVHAQSACRASHRCGYARIYCVSLD